MIRALITKMLFRTDATGLKRVETSTSNAKRQMRAASRAAWQLKRDLRGLAVGFKGFIAAVVAGRLAKLVTVDFAKSADAIAKFSKATGVSTDTLQKFYHAMELGGATREESEKGILKFLKTVNDAARGLSTAKKAFREIGLDPKQVTADEKGLKMVADAFASMTDKGKRAAAAQDIFGRGARKLIPGLEVGSKKLEEYFKEAEKLGKVIGPKALADAEKFNDEFMRSKAVFMGVRNMVAARLLPALTKNMEAFRRWAAQGDNLERMLKRVRIGLKVATAALIAFMAVKFASHIMTLVGVLRKLVFMLRATSTAAMAAQAKLFLIVAVLLLIAGAIQDIWVFSKGGESVFGTLMKKLGLATKAKRAVEGASRALRQLWEVIQAVGRAFFQVARLGLGVYLEYMLALQKVVRTFEPELRELGEAMTELWEELLPLLEEGQRIVIKGIKGMIPVLQFAARQIVSMIQTMIKEAKQAWEDLQPAIREVKEELLRLWTDVKPALTELWNIQKLIWGLTWRAAREYLPSLSETAATTFRVIAFSIRIAIRTLTFMVRNLTLTIRVMKKAGSTVAAAWKTAMDPVNRLLDAIKSKISWILGKIGKVTGSKWIQRISGIVAPGKKEAGEGAPGGTTVQQSNKATVGNVVVKIAGSTGMGAGAVAEAVKSGVKKGLQDTVNKTFSSWSPIGVFGGS